MACGESGFFDIISSSPACSFHQYQPVRCVLIAEGSSKGHLATTLFYLIVSKVEGEAGGLRYSRIGLATLDHSRRAAFSHEILSII